MPRAMAGCFGLFGAVIGAVTGFLVRGHLNQKEVIGYANIPDQLFKLGAWAILGAALGVVGVVILGRVLRGWRRTSDGQ